LPHFPMIVHECVRSRCYRHLSQSQVGPVDLHAHEGNSRLHGDHMSSLLLGMTSEGWCIPVQNVEPCTGSTSAFRRLEAPTCTRCLGCAVVMGVSSYPLPHLHPTRFDVFSRHQHKRHSSSARTSASTMRHSHSHLLELRLMTASIKAEVVPRCSRFTVNSTIKLVRSSLPMDNHPSTPSCTSSIRTRH